MKKPILYPGIICLVVLFLLGCGNSVRKDFDKLMATGVQLEEGKTIEVKVGDKVFLTYGHSSGVDPVYWQREVIMEPKDMIGFEGEQSFMFEPESAGGPVTEVILLNAQSPGMATVNTYLPDESYQLYVADFQNVEEVTLNLISSDLDSMLTRMEAEEVSEDEIKLYLINTGKEYEANPAAFERISIYMEASKASEYWNSIVTEFNVDGWPHPKTPMTKYTVSISE